MDEIKFEDWRLNAFWGSLALATGIGGFVLGWSWRDRPDALAGVSILAVLSVVGTLLAVFAALWVASRQRADSAAENARAGEVAYWIVHPEVVQLRDIHFPLIESLLRNVGFLADGERIPAGDAATLRTVAERMSMQGTSQVLDKLPLLKGGAGVPVAEVYGRLSRLKTQIASIGSRDEGMDLSFRVHVSLNLERVQRLLAALKSLDFPT